MNNAQYFYNKVDLNSKGKRIFDFDKLYPGQKYILVQNQYFACGPLVKKTLSNLPGCRMNYYGIYFRVGFAKYDGITISDQTHQYHLQSHQTFRNLQTQIYECYLSRDLQIQINSQSYCIIMQRYYKKTVMNLCKELNICEDMQYYILKFL